MKFSPSRIFILLFILPFLIYSNTFSVPFLFDDSLNIVGNPTIRSLADFLDPAGTRYVGFLSFALNYAIGGLNVFGYHLVNLLIHIANGLLVYWLVLLLLRLPAGSLEGSSINHQPSTINHQRSFSPIALLTALLFLVHPIQTQAVTYIVQRFASLVTLFYLLAVVCYLKWRLSQTIGPRGPIRLIYFFASLLSCIFAMKTKENGLTLPLMILLVEWIFFRGIRGASKAPSSGKATWSLPLNGPSGLVQWLALVPFLLTLFIIPLSLSYQEPSTVVDPTRMDIPTLSRWEYLFTQFRVIVTYLRLLVLPINQNLDYDYPVYHSFFQPAVFLSFLFLLGLLGFAIRLIGRIGHIRLVGFGILWFFLALSVESSLYPIKDVIFEHRVYLPSVGFFLAAGFLALPALERWKKMRGLVVILVVIIVGGFSVATFQRNKVWRDPAVLWEDVVRKSPNKERGHSNLGKVYQERGRLEEAIQEYRTALKSNPGYAAGIYDNLGVVYGQMGRWEEALRLLQTALKLNPDDAEIHNNLGIVYKNQGHVMEAIAEFKTALRLKPDHAPAHYNLGLAYEAKGDRDSAVPSFEAALRLNPDYAEAHNALGIAYGEAGRIAEAIAEYQGALRLNPNDAEAHNNLGTAYRAQGRLPEAIDEFRSALRLRPNMVEARVNLGLAYQGKGMLKEARAEFEEALKIRPDFPEARQALESISQGGQ